MSRIGLKPISLPAGVTFEQNGNVAIVKGSKGEVSVHIPADVSVEVADGQITVHLNCNENNERQAQKDHGTTAANITNAVKGVTEGWKKELEIAGTGYRASMKGANVTMFLGYSHMIERSPIGKYTTIKCTDETHIVVEGCSKEDVGQTAASIYDAKRPDVYGNKGVHYKGQKMIKKVGKRAASGKK